MGRDPSSETPGGPGTGSKGRITEKIDCSQAKGSNQKDDYAQTTYHDQEDGQQKSCPQKKLVHDFHGMWKGETVFIIGGGPSLIGFDYSPIYDRKVIGVNNAYRFGDWIDVCWFGDLKWFHWHQKELRASFKGFVAHCNTRSDLRRLKWMTCFGRESTQGLSTKPNVVRWNRCSGLSAINLAYHMGASTVFLLGFDMNHNGEQKNWHKDHVEDQSLKKAESRYTRFLSSCRYINRDAKKLGFKIINGNPDSAIEQFPKMTLREFLENEK